MPKKNELDDDDPYLYAAQHLQEGLPVAKVRKLLVAEKGLPADEARTMVLNVYAAVKLEEGLKAAEVRRLLLAEKDVTPEEARAIVAEIRQANEEPAPAAAEGGGGGGGMRYFGIILLILGIGSFLLPLMGRQFRVLSFLGDAAPFVGAGLAVIGVGLVVLSFRTR